MPVYAYAILFWNWLNNRAKVFIIIIIIIYLRPFFWLLWKINFKFDPKGLNAHCFIEYQIVA